MTLQWQYMKKAWAYESQVLDGVKITVSGMLAGAHLVGAGNLNKYLLSGGDVVPADGNGVKVSTYIKQFAGYDAPFSADHTTSATSPARTATRSTCARSTPTSTARRAIRPSSSSAPRSSTRWTANCATRTT